LRLRLLHTGGRTHAHWEDGDPLQRQSAEAELAGSRAVNADCRYGFVQVELLDPQFQPYEGFSAQLCDPVVSPPDRVWHTIRWQGSSDLRALWNKPVRIRFHLHEASLFIPVHHV
jgi:hypothetical protein